MTEVFNIADQKQKRKALRRNLTPAEAKLWLQLQRRQVLDHRFRRQYSVGPYVLDFYCPQLKLAIEVDGDSHFVDGAKQKDEKRTQFVEQFGIRFLRFTNVDVFQNLDGVMQAIYETVQSLSQGVTRDVSNLRKEIPEYPL